ncbi:MAG: SDR family oxidoreductase [Clostridia bacterium]
MDYSGKTVIITGGANGIGRCMAESFGSAGARVSVIDKENKAPDCDLFYQGDITEEKTLEAFKTLVVERYGTIDVLVNNACVSRKGILSGCGYEDFLYVLKTGAVAPYMLTMLFLPYFNEGGSVLNISSTRAFMSQADTESYSAAKGAISALTHAMAVSLAGRVRVNAIAPGWIDTTNQPSGLSDKRQHPVKRIGTPEDIAKMAMFLCSGDCGFITGQSIVIDGGMSRLMVYHEDAGWTYQE